MARKLKTYQTSIGFFDLAIAAPSMKAALDAWGADSNLFHQGFAREIDDPAVVAATMADPGVVLKRVVGSSGPYKLTADLPKNLSSEKIRRPAPKAKVNPHQGVNDKTARRAALAYEKEQSRREQERAEEKATAEKERKRRETAVEKSRAAIEAAGRKHERIADAIEREREELEKRSQAEDARWEKQKEKLKGDLRKAGASD